VTKRIGVFFLGGTISMSPAEGGGVEARLGPDELLAAVPSLQQLDLLIDPTDVGRVPSASLSFSTLLDLVRNASAGDYDGAVIVQGTDTIDETAFLFDLLWPHESPLVVTGAMRNPTQPGADGPANLLAAIAVASADDAHGLGSLVVMNDEIHAARLVSKVNTASPAAFVSANYGPLGYLREGIPVIGLRPRRRSTHAVPASINVSVPIYMAALDDDALVLNAARTADGLIVAGSGGGHVNAKHAKLLGELAHSKPVILSTRTASGRVLTTTYASDGAEIDLIRRGLIPGGELTALKARLLLSVMLSNAATRDEIVAEFVF
jgi:L-asparaginase